MDNNPLWDKLDMFALSLGETFSNHLKPFHNEKHDQQFDGWTDSFWCSDNIRKCHLKTINDGRMWLLHINIFPREGVNLPILGFDIVASKTKISGSFFDFSPVIRDPIHPLCVLFKESVKDIEWNKPRDLPEWATEIFSESMVAAGSITYGDELDQLIDVSTGLIGDYLASCNDSQLLTTSPTKTQLNKYCKNQKMNKHLHRSILAMGISEEAKDRYINNVLFEEI